VTGFEGRSQTTRVVYSRCAPAAEQEGVHAVFPEAVVHESRGSGPADAQCLQDPPVGSRALHVRDRDAVKWRSGTASWKPSTCRTGTRAPRLTQAVMRLKSRSTANGGGLPSSNEVGSSAPPGRSRVKDARAGFTNPRSLHVHGAFRKRPSAAAATAEIRDRRWEIGIHDGRTFREVPANGRRMTAKIFPIPSELSRADFAFICGQLDEKYTAAGNCARGSADEGVEPSDSRRRNRGRSRWRARRVAVLRREAKEGDWRFARAGRKPVDGETNDRGTRPAPAPKAASERAVRVREVEWSSERVT